MRHANGNIFSGTNVAASAESDIYDLREVYGYSLHIKWTKNAAVVAGSFKIQVSNDKENFIDYTGATLALVDASGEGYIEKDGIHWQWMKVILTYTSGDFDFDCYVGTKG